MTLSTQEMSDRFEIQDLLYHYADIIDRKACDELRDVFTEDAHIDYSAFGGSVGDLETTIAFLKEALPAFPNSQHLNANLQIKVNGDEGTGRIMCFNPMEAKNEQGEPHVFLLGLWYVDKYVRTDRGWRIRERAEEKSWAFNVPDFMKL